MAARERRDRGALETEILAVLRHTGEPMTAGQVHETLDDELAYTTVMTTLSRLHDKGALTRALSGRAYLYRLAGDEQAVDAALTARRMRRLLDAGSDRNVALRRFVSELEPSDERVLAELLRELDQDRHSDEES